MELSIKNMVCDRCISTVKGILSSHGIEYQRVSLGYVLLKEPLPLTIKKQIESSLEKEGMPVLKSRGEKLIRELKALVRSKALNDSEPEINLSDFVESHLGLSYRKLNIIFSEFEQKTINRYYIELKIEKAKELISYDFHSISEISYLLNYSSPQHLSRQFKKITGMSPSEYKKSGGREKLDKI